MYGKKFILKQKQSKKLLNEFYIVVTKKKIKKRKEIFLKSREKF